MGCVLIDVNSAIFTTLSETTYLDLGAKMLEITMDNFENGISPVDILYYIT